MINVTISKQKFFEKLPLITLIILLINKILLSRYMDFLFKKSYFISVLLTALLYLIFLFFIFWNFIDDFKNGTNRFYIGIYIAFICYYSMISFYRLLMGLEAKESMYYTIILLGTFSMFRIIVNRNGFFRGNLIINEISTFAFLTIIYWIMYRIIFVKYIPYSPLNENIIAAILVITIPVIFRKLLDAFKNKKDVLICQSIIVGEITCVITLGSRAAFYLLVIELLFLLVCNLKKRTFIASWLISITCSFLIISLLFVLNVGDVRYSVYREMSIISKIFVNTNKDESTGQVVKNSDEPLLVEQIAVEQIERSDTGRKGLMKRSIEQIKENPLFGTGKLFYVDTIEGIGVFNQSAHNGILETLNGYGIIGFFVILLLLYFVIFRGLFYYKSFFKYPELTIIITVFLFYGMVQPLVYDEVILPLVLIEMALYLDKSIVR